MTTLLGIILGLACAICQSTGYLMSRLYVIKRPNGNMQLMVTAHIWQMIICLPLMILLWPENMPELNVYIKPMLSDAGGYLMGQAGLFFALSKSDASRIAPMLGLKILVVACAVVLFLNGQLSNLQWIAVALSVIAAFVLNKTGGSMPAAALVGVAITVIGYAISDINIQAFIKAIHVVGPTRAPILAMSITFSVCGILGIALLPWYGTRNRQDWLAALPYALSWLAAMAFFYGAIAVVQVVFATIVQSSRGLLSVMLGVVVAHYLHMPHLEAKHGRDIIIRRALAAILMAVAISLYASSKL